MSGKAMKAYDKYDKKVKETTDKLIGKYGNKTLSWATNKKLSDEVYSLIDEMSRLRLNKNIK